MEYLLNRETEFGIGETAKLALDWKYKIIKVCAVVCGVRAVSVVRTVQLLIDIGADRLRRRWRRTAAPCRRGCCRRRTAPPSRCTSSAARCGWWPKRAPPTPCAWAAIEQPP